MFGFSLQPSQKKSVWIFPIAVSEGECLDFSYSGLRESVWISLLRSEMESQDFHRKTVYGESVWTFRESVRRLEKYLDFPESGSVLIFPKITYLHFPE